MLNMFNTEIFVMLLSDCGVSLLAGAVFSFQLKLLAMCCADFTAGHCYR